MEITDYEAYAFARAWIFGAEVAIAALTVFCCWRWGKIRRAFVLPIFFILCLAADSDLEHFRSWLVSNLEQGIWQQLDFDQLDWQYLRGIVYLVCVAFLFHVMWKTPSAPVMKTGAKGKE